MRGRPQPPRRAAIASVGVCVPERVLTNQDLEKMVDTSDDWITERTGIKERRIAADDVATSDMALLAAREALDKADVAAADLDLIIVATVTPDMPFPATACLIQDALGATKAAAFDLAAGCTGFVYGLVTASQFIECGTYESILVIGSEKLSSITDWTDRGTCVLFGDGAGAVVLGPCEPDRGILAFELGSDGSGAELLCLPAGGSRLPATVETVQERRHCIVMNGREVFRFAARALSGASQRVMERVGIEADQVSVVIPHQANQRITEAASRRLGVPADRVFENIERYGNTSGASIPIALYEAVSGGLIHDGDYVILTGFGAGLTWGACVIKWVGSSA